MGNANVLQDELGYFAQHRDEFLKIAEGKFVLIKGAKHYGFFDDDRAAYEEGARLFGTEPFLIQEVLPTDTAIEIPAYFFGLIHANV